MRLQKRQYVLIVLILALGTFNLARWFYYRHQAGPPAPPIIRGTSPAWSLFDAAANLRDAADEQFLPAFKAFNASVDTTNATSVPPQASKDELADLHGCQTWLDFYRQDFLHPGNKPGWRDQTSNHVKSCVANQRDIAQ